MLDQLLQKFQTTLNVRWGARLPVLLAKAKSFSSAAMARLRTTPEASREAEVERVVREAYMTGYRQAYMDGILDLIESADGEAAHPAARLEDGVH